MHQRKVQKNICQNARNKRKFAKFCSPCPALGDRTLLSADSDLGFVLCASHRNVSTSNCRSKIKISGEDLARKEKQDE